MSVVEAVDRDLEAIGRLAPEVAASAEAATARALAAELDAPNSATSKSMCARVLTDTLEALRARVPEREEADGLDDLTARRAARLAGRAAS